MRIKELRTEKNYTQAQLAEILEISQQNISKYENCKLEPDITTLSKLADFFKVTIDYLLERSDIRNCTNLSPCLSNEQQHLLNIFNRLNPKNQGALLERADVLLELQEEINKTTINPQKGA